MTRKKHGKVHRRTIELNEDLGVSEGREVEVQVTVLTKPPRKIGEGLLRTEGTLADEDEWDWIMDEIHKARKADHRPRVTGVRPRPPASVRAQGRRLDADGAGAGGFTDTFWVYDGDQAILEFAGGTATAPSHRYLWGPAVDQILADEQLATGSPAHVRWPLADWQGTIRDGFHERRDSCESEGLSGVWKGLLGEARSPAREGERGHPKVGR